MDASRGVTTGQGAAAVRAVAAASERLGADLGDPSAYAGFNAALLTFSGIFKGFLNNGSVARDDYELVLATVSSMMQAADTIRQGPGVRP